MPFYDLVVEARRRVQELRARIRVGHRDVVGRGDGVREHVARVALDHRVDDGAEADQAGDLWIYLDGELRLVADAAGLEPQAVDAEGALIALDPTDEGRVVRLAVPLDELPPPPTFEADVVALRDQHCAACHGPQGYAHSLHAPDEWAKEIDAIISAVAVGQMPLPPNPTLTPSEVDLLVRWREAGTP